MLKIGDIVYRKNTPHNESYTVIGFTITNKVRVQRFTDDKVYCFMEENLSINKHYVVTNFRNYYLENV